MIDVLAPPTPIVFIEGDDVLASSLGIAERFGKQHFHVLRDVDDWIAKLAKAEIDASALGCIDRSAYFVPADYIDDSGRSHRAFNLNRSGAMLLIFGYKGIDAAKVQMSYVAAFDSMEVLLRAGQQPKRQTKAKPVSTEPKPIRITGALLRKTALACNGFLTIARALPAASSRRSSLRPCRIFTCHRRHCLAAPGPAATWRRNSAGPRESCLVMHATRH